MEGKIKINIRGAKGIVSSDVVTSGKNAEFIVKVPQDGKYNIELLEAQSGKAPQLVKIRRAGNNLILEIDDENTGDIVLEDFYNNEELRVIGMAEDGQYYEYIPTSGEMADYAPLLQEGSHSLSVLGGEGFAIADPAETGTNFGWLPFLLFGGGALAAGGAIYAASRDDDNNDDRQQRDVNTTLNPVTDSDKDGRPEFSGTASRPDSEIVITLPDGSKISTTTDGNGNWAIEAPNSQPNGPITVVVTDKDGNTNTITDRYEDDSAPGVPSLTANDDNQLAGEAEPGSTITITDPKTGESTTVVTDNNGKWSISPNPVGEGADNVTVVAEDPAGNTSPPLIINRPDLSAPDNITSGLKIDTIALTDDVAPIVGKIADGASTNDTRPTYSGVATGDIASVNIYDNGQLVGNVKPAADGRWSFTSPVSLAEGSSHNYTAAAVDKAGNEGPRVSGTGDEGWTFTIDSLPPDNNSSGIINNSESLIDDVGPVTGEIADGETTDDSRPTWNGKATSDVDHVNIYDNGKLIGSAPVGEDGRWSFTPATDLAEGKHELTVTAVDKAGNEGPQVSGTNDGSLSFVVDMTSPGIGAIESGSITLTDDIGPVQGSVVDGSVIDDAQPTYAGTISSAGLAEGVVSVNIYDRGELIGSAAVDQSTGAWSFTPGTSLASGAHSLTVAPVDAAGNVGPQMSGTADDSWDFTLLTSAPAQPSIENVTDNDSHGENADVGPLQKGQHTNDATLILNGSAAPELTVQIWATDSLGNRVMVGEGRTDDSGRWSITTAALGADGEYSLTAIAVNDAGIASAETGGFPIVLDTTPPTAATATLHDDQGDSQGTVAADGVTDDRAPLLQGTGEPGASVTVYLDGSSEPAGQVTIGDDGNWTLQLPTLTDGPHRYQTLTSDAAGNETRGAEVSFTVDTSAVELSIDHANDNAGSITGKVLHGGLTDDATPELQGTTHPHAIVTIKDKNGDVCGTATADQNGHWRHQLDEVVDGTHAWTAEVTSLNGNIVQATISLTVNTQAPLVPVIDAITDDVGTVQGPVTDGVTDDPAPTFSGSAEPGTVITVYDGETVLGQVTADQNGKWNYTPTTGLNEGEHRITVTGTDAVGNESARSPEVIFTLDTSTTAPTVDVNTADEIGGTAEPGAVITVTRPADGSETTAVADDEGRWSLKPNPLQPGNTDVTIVATDPAGNSNTTLTGGPDDVTAPGEEAIAPGSITLTDDIGPVQGSVVDGSVIDDAQPTYAGTISSAGLAEGVVSVNIYDRGELIGSAAVDQSTGAWSFTPGTSLASGAHSLTVAAVDAAGNVGPQMSGTADDSWDFTLLTSAPAQPSIENVTDNDSHGENADVGPLQKGQHTNDATLILNGSAAPELTVQIWATDSLGNRVMVGEGRTDDSGRWSITTGALGADGEYSLTAIAVNDAGIASAETGGFPIVLDTTPPAAATATLHDDQGDSQGTVAADGVTDDRAPLLQGTGEPGASVTVYLDGSSEPAGQVTIGDDGNWTLQLPTLTDGPHRYQTLTSDAAGNETRGAEVSFTVDTSAVELSIDHVNDNTGSITGKVLHGGLTDDATPELQGTTRAGAEVTIRDAGGAVVGTVTADSGGQWSWQSPAVADGEHSWTAEVTSGTGNTVSAGITLNVDTQPPAAPTINTLADDVGTKQGITQVSGSVIDDPTPTLSGTAEAGTLVRLYDDEQLLGEVYADKDGNWNFTPTTSLVEGIHSITATATDAAGNVSEQSDNWAFVLDTTPPNVGISDNSVESLSGMSEPGATITVIDAAGDKHYTVADNTGRWIMSPNPVATGTSGQIYATDPAGNQGEPLAFQGSALAGYDLLNESTGVNTTKVGDQANPTTTRLSDGRIVVIWQGDGASQTEVYMQLYSADGVHKIGTEQQVNQRTANYQDSPQVIALADGGFLVVYESWRGGLDSHGDGVLARRYGADGQAMTDEFLVNVTTDGDQNRPSALATADGGYIITWQDSDNRIVQRTYGEDNQPSSGEVVVATGSEMGGKGGPEMASFTDEAHQGMYITVWNAASGPADNDSTGVVGQIFGADGKPLGGNVQFNTTMDGSQNYADVITLNDGSFVIFWDSTDSGSNDTDIRAAHYTVDPVTGALQVKGTGDFIVNSYTAGAQYKPVGVALEDGGYLIIWGSEDGDGDGSAMYAQRYDAHDHKIGREFLVNTTTHGNQGYGGSSVDVTHVVDATLMADGNIYITWQSDNVDGDGTGVEGIVLNPDAAYYSEFTVNTATAGEQRHSSVAAFPDGSAIVVWESTTGDGSGTCIKGQLLDARGQPVGGEFLVNTSAPGDQLSPQVAVLQGGGFEVLWSSGNYIKGQKFIFTLDGDKQVNGVTKSGGEISITSGTDADHQTHPMITTLDDGGHLVVWQATSGGKWQIYARQYDADGVPVDSQNILVATDLDAPWLALPGDWNPLPAITTLSDGKVAIAYSDKVTGYDAMVVIYDPETRTIGTPIMVNQTTANDQASPKITALENGNFIVSWDSDNNTGPDQTGYSVWGRIYDATGEAVTEEFMINTTTAGDQSQPVIVSHTDGSFVVVFISSSDGVPGANTHGIYAQYFDANGHKIGQQMQINQLIYGDQVEVDASFLAGGQLYVTWTDKGVADGSGSAVKGRIVDLAETLGLADNTAVNNDPTTIEYQPATPAVVDSLPPNVGISTNTATRLGGQTEPGATVTVTDANGKAYNAVADSTGAWHIEPNPLSVGEHGAITVADSAGNQSASIHIRGAALDGYDLLNESIRVNTTQVGDQANPTTTRLADGRIVVIWQGDGASATEVFMQLYDANGVNKIGTEQQVNQRTANNQDSPQVVALADGGFLVVYESYNGGIDPSGDGIVARRYGVDGQAMTDEFLVNTTTEGFQNRPSAMATPDGGYIISWKDKDQTLIQRTYGDDDQPKSGEVVVATGSSMGSHGGPEMAAFTDSAHNGMYITVWNVTGGVTDQSSSGVMGQIFGPDGKTLGNAFQVNTTMDGSQNYPDVITLIDGSFVVFWDTNDADADGSDVRAVHYAVDPQTGEVTVKGAGDFIVNSSTEGKQYKPVGVALEDGGYLIIWGSAGGDGSGSAIFAQRYGANDEKVGREFIVNTTTFGNQGTGGDSVDVTHILDATLMADGNVYITWQSDNTDSSGIGIEGIVVNPDAAYYSEFMVNSTTDGAQSDPMVVSLPNGGLFQVWVSSDGSGTGIRGQMLDAKGQPVGGELTINSTIAGNQLTPVVLENGNISVVWSSPATGGANYIKGQQFTYTYDEDGNITGLTPTGGEFNVSSGVGATGQSHPVVTALADGGYMVVWQAVKEGSFEQFVYGRQYNAEGEPVTPEMVLGNSHIGTTVLDYEPVPAVTTLTNGTVVITYTASSGALNNDVVFLMFDPRYGEPLMVNQTKAGGQASPGVSALENGNFVVTWDSDNNSGPDQSGFGVWGRIYDSEGNPVSNEFLINTVTQGDQHLAQVVSRPDGSFVAVFISSTDSAPGEGTYGIYAQYFDVNGNKIGQQMQINQLVHGDQVDVNATFMEGGQLYVTWTDKGVGDGSGSAIKGRIVDLNQTLGLSDDGDGVTHIPYQPAQFYVNGSDGNDVLDARGAVEVDGKAGNDTLIINSTSLSSLDGGDGFDTLVWDSGNNLELGSVSAQMDGIEAIHLGNGAAQMLVIRAEDVLELTKANGEAGHTLRITGDEGTTNNNGAKDTVSINKDEWNMSTSENNKGVNYDIYVNNEDPTIKLMIQHGMNVL